MRTERTSLKARLLAILLVIVMVIGMIPGAAFAAGEDEAPDAQGNTPGENEEL